MPAWQPQQEHRQQVEARRLARRRPHLLRLLWQCCCKLLVLNCRCVSAHWSEQSAPPCLRFSKLVLTKLFEQLGSSINIALTTGLLDHFVLLQWTALMMRLCVQLYGHMYLADIAALLCFACHGADMRCPLHPVASLLVSLQDLFLVLAEIPRYLDATRVKTLSPEDTVQICQALIAALPKHQLPQNVLKGLQKPATTFYRALSKAQSQLSVEEQLQVLECLVALKKAGIGGLCTGCVSVVMLQHAGCHAVWRMATCNAA